MFESNFTRQDIIEEIKFAQRIYQELTETFPMVICHMDIKTQNIIYNEEQG